MADEFDSYRTGLKAPATDAQSVTPSDTTDLTNDSRAIYVGTGGDLTVVMKGGQTITFKNVVGGSVLAIRASRVNATNTTASDIVALW